jgi:3-oxoacyl-[acyl-carrier-protein] synthase II
LKPVYITHTSAVTPQLQSEKTLFSPLIRDENLRFKVIEPDYTGVIPPMQLRRMSRVLRMGVYAGMDCLRKAGLEKPDGILTGTAKGSMTDTEKFVKELKSYDETALNPTPFILSTYNAINGAIALQTKATGYNQTFVHRGSSFENALYDTQLKLNPVTEKQQYLVGCFDELTDEYFHIKDKVNYWKRGRDNTLPLWQQSESPGTIGGEGTAFFLLSNKPDNAIVAIQNITTFYQATIQELEEQINSALAKAGWPADSIDLLVMGHNGNSLDEPYYDAVLQLFGNEVPVLGFKHLCGEYETSGGFALWLTCELLSGAELPEAVWYRKSLTDTFRPKRILYYNHYRGQDHNVVLLEKV